MFKWLMKSSRVNDPKRERGKSIFIGFGQTRQTPRVYRDMAVEAYQNNVIAYRCIDAIAKAVAAIPLMLNRNDKQVSNHPLLKLLKNPNGKYSQTGLLYSATAQLLIGGNCYIDAVVSKPLGQPLELFNIARPDLISVHLDSFGEIARYSYQPDNGHHRQASWDVSLYGDSDLLHIKGWHPFDDIFGMPQLMAAMSSIDQHNAAGDWNKRLLDGSGTPSGALYYEPRESYEALSEEQYNRLRKELDEQIMSHNNNRPLLLEGGLKWVQLSISPKDLEFLNGKRVSATEICAALGVPPQLVGIEGSQTYANYEQARLAFYEDTVIPIAKLIIERLDGWLTKRYDVGLVLSFDFDAIDAMQEKKRQLWAKLEGVSFLTINEKRKAIGYDEISGGDMLYMPANNLPIGADIESIMQEGAIKKPPTGL